MRLWPFRKALSGTPEVVEALHTRRASFWPLLGGGSRERITEVFRTAQSADLPWLYESSPAVRSVLDLIVRNIGQLDLRLYEEIDESEREPRPEHPAALSIRYPNEASTSDHFVRSVMKDFLIFDNAYVLKWRDRTNERIVMERIPAAMVEVLGDQIFRATGYRIHRSDGTFLDVTDPNDVIHWRGEGTRDPRMGVSKLDTLRNVIAEDAALQQAIVELANSGLVSPQWVSRPLEAPAWSNEARDRFEEDLSSRLRRADKRPATLEEGMELHNVGTSPRDAQALEIRRYVIEQVAQQYGVPLGMVTGDDEESQSVFYADCLPPYCELFTRWLNHGLLLGEYGLTEYCFEFNLDEKLMGDERLETLVSAAGAPIFTQNEARARVNLPALEEGEGLIVPLNVTKGGKPSPGVMPVQNPLGPAQDGSYREEPKAIQTKQLEVTSVPRVDSDMARQKRNIDKARPVFERHFRQQYAAMKSKSVNVKAANADDWNAKLAAAVLYVVKAIVELEGGIYVSRLGGDDFDMGQVENYLESQAEGAAKGINDATQADIDELGVEGAFDRARHLRVETAATAIGTRSTVFAREEAAKQSPFPETRVKTWIPNTERHMELAGETIPVGQSWSFEGRRLTPGSEPQCACSVTIS